jgi:hypothetical protein
MPTGHWTSKNTSTLPTPKPFVQASELCIDFPRRLSTVIGIISLSFALKKIIGGRQGASLAYRQYLLITLGGRRGRRRGRNEKQKSLKKF